MRIYSILALASSLATATLLAACEPEVALLRPEQSAADEAITLTVTVSDPELAERLGWTVGAGVPGASVYVRQDNVLDVQEFTTDELGMVDLADVPSARYWIWAEKVFEGLTPGDSDAPPPVLAGGTIRNLRRGTSISLDLRGHDRGSLVISEFYYHDAPWEIVDYNTRYDHQMYIELYNNSDTTIYLDGKIVGGGFSVDLDISSWPCTETAVWRNDPRGLWAQSFQRFPGGGTEYPLAPGEVVVIAEQAIDHSAIYPGLPDMRNADFQFHWEGRAINPEVPNMLPVQLRTNPTGLMMGLVFWVPFVADAIDIGPLERVFNIQHEFALFPNESLLDLAQIVNEDYMVPRMWSICGNMVHSSLDQLLGFVSPFRMSRPDAHLLAAHRKLLPDGSGLQRTGVTAAEWEIGPRSPGRLR